MRILKNLALAVGAGLVLVAGVNTAFANSRSIEFSSCKDLGFGKLVTYCGPDAVPTHWCKSDSKTNRSLTKSEKITRIHKLQNGEEVILTRWECLETPVGSPTPPVVVPPIVIPPVVPPPAANPKLSVWPTQMDIRTTGVFMEGPLGQGHPIEEMIDIVTQKFEGVSNFLWTSSIENKGWLSWFNQINPILKHAHRTGQTLIPQISLETSQTLAPIIRDLTSCLILADQIKVFSSRDLDEMYLKRSNPALHAAMTPNCRYFAEISTYARERADNAPIYIRAFGEMNYHGSPWELGYGCKMDYVTRKQYGCKNTVEQYAHTWILMSRLFEALGAHQIKMQFDFSAGPEIVASSRINLDGVKKIARQAEILRVLEIIQREAPDAIDAIGFHPYTKPFELKGVRYYPTFKQLATQAFAVYAKAKLTHKPMVVGEMGAGLTPAREIGDNSNIRNATSQERAEWVRGAFKSARCMGISAITYFNRDASDYRLVEGSVEEAALIDEVKKSKDLGTGTYPDDCNTR